MKNTLTVEQMLSIVTATVEQVEMEVTVKRERTGVNMMYDFLRHEVIIDTARVKKACDELSVPLPLETYIRTLTIHELGHAMDRDALLASLDRAVEIIGVKKQAAAEKRPCDLPYMEMLIEEHETDIRFEETAWANAELINRFYEIIDWDIFLQVKESSLATYRAAYEKDAAKLGSMRNATDLLSL